MSPPPIARPALPVCLAAWRLQPDCTICLSSRFRFPRRGPFFDAGDERGKAAIIDELSRATSRAVRVCSLVCLRTSASLSVYVREWDKVLMASVGGDERELIAACEFRVSLVSVRARARVAGLNSALYMPEKWNRLGSPGPK